MIIVIVPNLTWRDLNVKGESCISITPGIKLRAYQTCTFFLNSVSLQSAKNQRIHLRFLDLVQGVTKEMANSRRVRVSLDAVCKSVVRGKNG